MTYTPPLNGGRINVTVGGNSTSAGAGYALASTGTVTLAGGNNITLSQNGNAVTISGGAGGGGVALANSQTTYSSGTVNMLEGGGALTIASGAGQSLNFSVPQTSSLSATGAVSISTNASTISIGAPNQTVQTQNVVDLSIAGNSTSAGAGYALISSGTAILAGGNNITLSQNAQSITISGAAQTNQTLSYAMSSQTVGNTSGMSVDARSITHQGRGMVSVGASTSAGGSSLIFSATQSVQPGINSIQVSNTTYTSGKVIFSNANNISFGSSAGSVITASFAGGAGGGIALYDGANSISSGTASLADSNGVSFGINGQTVTASVNQVNMTLGGNSTSAGAGYALMSSGTVTLAGGNNVTLSQDGNAVTVSAPNFATATSPFQIQFAGNTAGTMSTVTTGAVQFAGGNNITLSQSQQSVTISGAGDYTYSYFNPQDAYLQVAGQIGQKTLMIQPTPAPNVVFDRIMLPINYSNASNSSNSFTVSAYVGVYTRNVSTLSLVFSVSTSYNITNSGTVGSYSNYGGMRLLSVGVGANTSISQGQYQVGIMSITTTGGGAGMSMSNMVASQINSSFSGIFGVASAVSAQYTRGLGWMSVTTGGIPNSVALSDMVGNSSAALRQPLFYFISGTV